VIVEVLLLRTSVKKKIEVAVQIVIDLEEQANINLKKAWVS